MARFTRTVFHGRYYYAVTFTREILQHCTNVKIAGKFVRRVFPLSDICSAYESWRGHMKRGNSFHAVERMDLYFKKLFGFHPNNKIEWRKALCT